MRIRATHLLIASIICLFSCKENKPINAHEANVFSQLLEKKQLSKPLIMAHRGRLDDSMPENAISSFEKINQFSERLLIEFDVRRTKDNVYVLLHDETLDRTTTGSGLLTDKTYDEISQFRLISNIGDTTNYRIPKFEEALYWSKSKNLMVIDAKPGAKLKEIVALIESADAVENCILICYSVEDALRYNGLNPNLLLAVGFNSWENLERIKKSGLPIENLVALTPTSLQKESFYEEIEKMGVRIAYGTYQTLDVKNFEAVEDIYSQYFKKFDIITTDRARNVYLLLNEKE